MVKNGNTKVIAVDNYLRNFISIISDDKNEIEKVFNLVYDNLDLGSEIEPMMNVLCSFTNNQWRVIIFPRGKQRPSCFYLEDEKQIISSPASVEMGGTLVLPREEDFKKITQKEIEEIYEEVSLSRRSFGKLILAVKESLK